MIQDLLHVDLGAIEKHRQPLLRCGGRTYGCTDAQALSAEFGELELALVEAKLLLELEYLLEIVSVHVLQVLPLYLVGNAVLLHVEQVDVTALLTLKSLLSLHRRVVERVYVSASLFHQGTELVVVNLSVTLRV